MISSLLLEKLYEIHFCVCVVAAVFLTINMIQVHDMYLLHSGFFATTIDTYTMVYDMYLSHGVFFVVADCYADLIPSFRVWSCRENKKSIFVPNRNRLLARRW